MYFCFFYFFFGLRRTFQMYSGINCWCDAYYTLLFLISRSYSLYFSVYRNRINRYLLRFVENVPEVWTIFVRTICWVAWGVGVLNGPSSCSITESTLRALFENPGSVYKYDFNFLKITHTKCFPVFSKTATPQLAWE